MQCTFTRKVFRNNRASRPKKPAKLQLFSDMTKFFYEKKQKNLILLFLKGIYYHSMGGSE